MQTCLLKSSPAERRQDAVKYKKKALGVACGYKLSFSLRSFAESEWTDKGFPCSRPGSVSSRIAPRFERNRFVLIAWLITVATRPSSQEHQPAECLRGNHHRNEDEDQADGEDVVATRPHPCVVARHAYPCNRNR